MSNHFKHLGIRDDDLLGQKMARQFLRDSRAHGLSQQQAEHIIATCARNEQNWMGMPAELAVTQFEEQTGHMLADSDLDFSFDWLERVGTRGLEEPSVAEKVDELARLEEMSRDPDGEYYKGASANELQRRHLELIEGGEIADAQFEQAASEATATLDGDYDVNAFDETNAADDAADYGDENYGQ